MTILQLTKLSVAELKNKAKSTDNRSEKTKLISAMLLKALSTVVFAIIMISLLNSVFSPQNSSIAVVIFCIFLSIRFVNYGYNIKDSILSLLIIFAIFAFAPIFSTKIHPVIAMLVNFSSIFIILLLTCNNPYMGNANIYIFSYVFINGSPVEGTYLTLRIVELLLGWILCSTLFYFKHKNKCVEKRIKDILKSFRFSDEKYQWEFLIALGVSSVIVIGLILDVPKYMWIGFSCASILCTYKGDIRGKARDRLIGVIIGSILFPIIYSIFPDSLKGILGIISGILLGLCTQYKYSSLINCFGALMIASTIYGIVDAPIIRIVDNIVGCFVGIGLYSMYYSIIRSNKATLFLKNLDKKIFKEKDN